MQLTLYTDFSLRVLIYLSMHPDRLVTIREISDYFAISRNHLVKVVHNLSRQGIIDTVQGKRGGLRLASEAASLTVGAIVRATEPHFHMAECFQPEAEGRCAVEPVCGLKHVLDEATDAYLQVLDRHKVGDLLLRAPVPESDSA